MQSLQGAGSGYEALIDVPSRVFDADFAGQLSSMGAVKTLRYILITRLTPERLPVLAAVLRACQQQGLQLWLTNPALQLLNDRAAADETLANALKGVQVGRAAGRALRPACVPAAIGAWGTLCGRNLQVPGCLRRRCLSCLMAGGRRPSGGAGCGGSSVHVQLAALCARMRATPGAKQPAVRPAGGGGVARQRAAPAGQAHAAVHPHPHAALARPGVNLQRGG